MGERAQQLDLDGVGGRSPDVAAVIDAPCGVTRCIANARHGGTPHQRPVGRPTLDGGRLRKRGPSPWSTWVPHDTEWAWPAHGQSWPVGDEHSASLPDSGVRLSYCMGARRTRGSRTPELVNDSPVTNDPARPISPHPERRAPAVVVKGSAVGHSGERRIRLAVRIRHALRGEFRLAARCPVVRARWGRDGPEIVIRCPVDVRWPGRFDQRSVPPGTGKPCPIVRSRSVTTREIVRGTW